MHAVATVMIGERLNCHLGGMQGFLCGFLNAMLWT